MAFLSRPAGLVWDPRDRFWVADAGNRRIVSLTLSGELIAIVGAARLHDPRRLVLHGDRLFIADPVAHAIVDLQLVGSCNPQRLEASDRLSDVAFDPTQNVVYAAYDDRIEALNLTVDDRRVVFDQSVTAICLSPDRRRLYVAKGDIPEVVVIEEDRTASVCRLATPALALSMSAAGLVAMQSRSLTGINLRHGTQTTIWQAPTELPALSAVACLPNRDYLVSAGDSVYCVSRDGVRCTEVVPMPPRSNVL